MKTNDYFLARWMAGEISDDALREQVDEAAFNEYVQLRQLLDTAQLPQTELDSHYAAIKHKKSRALDRKYARRYRWMGWAAAAVIALALFFTVSRPIVAKTATGVQAAIALPDGSTAWLAPQSQVKTGLFFKLYRELELEGTAYFEVAKGRSFTVKTRCGTVEVLGTHFSVSVRGGVLEARCYEGKVAVADARSKTVLQPGQAIRLEALPVRWDFTDGKPKAGISDFHGAPIRCVIAEFSAQFGKQVVYPEALSSIRFTGAFPHGDWRAALQSICIPLELHLKTLPDGTIELER